MQVTFVALNYRPSVGGAQEHVRQLAEGLAARGHQVEVLTTDALRSPSGRDPGRIATRVETVDGVMVRRFRQPKAAVFVHRLFRRLYWHLPGTPSDKRDLVVGPGHAGPVAPGLVWAMARAVRDRDVVIACSAPFLTMALPPLLRRRGGAVVIGMPLLHASRTQPHRRTQSALRRCHATVASTRFEGDLHEQAGVAPERVAVIAPGTNPGAFRQVSPVEAREILKLPDRPTVGFVGRLASYKGIDTLLDAAPLLWSSRPETTVLVAGSTTGWTGHQSHPARQQKPGHVVVRENFADSQRDLLLASCDVIAFASSEESYGLSIVEAWAADRPVVAAAIPAVREVVRDGIDGVLVPPEDPEALAAALVRLLDDPSASAAMASAGRTHVIDHLTWPTIVDAWETLIVECQDAMPVATSREA